MTILENGRPNRIRVGSPIDQRLFDELSPEEQEELRQEARKKVAAERQKLAREKFLAQAIEDERRESDPTKQKIPIFLDLAGHSQYILLDGTYYHHGHTYYVTQDVYAVLMEQQTRGWAHEEEVGEPNRKHYRKPSYVGTQNFVPPAYDPVASSKGTAISAKTGAVTNAPKANDGVVRV